MMRSAFGVLALLAVLSTAGTVAAQEAPGRLPDGEITAAPVVFEGATLFQVRGVSSFPAEVRAKAIRARLEGVAADPSIPVDTLRAVEADGDMRIVAGDRHILTLSAADASFDQVPLADLAKVHVARIQQAVTEYRAARSAPALRSGALRALAATAALATALLLALWFWRWQDRFIARRLQSRITSVGVQSFEIVRAERVWQALRGGLMVIRTVAFLAIGLLYVGYVMGQFPWTRGMAGDLRTFVLGPLEVIATGLIGHVPNVVFLVVLYYVVRFVLKLIRLFFDAVERGGVTLHNFEPEWAQPTYKILRVAIVAFGLIVAYPYIPGAESAAFKGVSLFIGIVFSLGSSSAISNIVAGYMMTYRRAFKVGDRVKIGGSVGEVIEMRLQVTHLRSFKNEEVIIPNSQILNGEVINYSSLSRSRGLILHTEVGIGYETPWRQVEAMLVKAADRTPELAKTPPPFVVLKALGDFAVTFEINAYCLDVSLMLQAYNNLHRHILDVFNEYGVQIMTPAYEGDTEQPKVVAPKDWYLAPAAPPGAPALAARPVEPVPAATGRVQAAE